MLADTDVLIDILRGHQPALGWLASLPELPYVSGYAALELAFGCQNAVELKHVREFQEQFTVVWPTAVDTARALDFADLHLSDGIGLLDSLTAALALSSGTELLTFNVRHFRAVPDLVTVQPYAR